MLWGEMGRTGDVVVLGYRSNPVPLASRFAIWCSQSQARRRCGLEIEGCELCECGWDRVNGDELGTVGELRM